MVRRTEQPIGRSCAHTVSLPAVHLARSERASKAADCMQPHAIAAGGPDGT